MNGVLYRTGTEIVPQLFSFTCSKDDLQKYIKRVDSPWVNGLNEFDLIEVEILYKKNEK